MSSLALIPASVSALLTFVSVALIRDPVGFSANVIKIETPQAAFYCRQLGIRNLMLGFILGALTYKGQLNSAATVLCIFPVLGVLDPFAGYMYRGKFVANDVTHVVTAVLFGGAGLWMLSSDA
jgi:putative Mn2+ efflux pump MntP